MTDKSIGALVGTAIAWLVIFIIIGGFYGCPKYNVWQQTLAGEAEFKRAEQNRKIKIEEAKAENESATSKAEAAIKIAHAEAEAEIIQAGGVAKANEIIGQSLKNNEAYLRYLWVQELSDNRNNVIYVPTETGLPILEAARLNMIPSNEKK